MTVSVIVLLSFAICCILTRKYKQDIFMQLKRKDHPLLFLYPTSYFLLEKMKTITSYDFEKSQVKFKVLFVASADEAKYLWLIHRCRQLSYLILVCTFSGFIAIFAGIKNVQPVGDHIFLRNTFGGGSINRNLILEVDGEHEEYAFNIEEQKYTKQQIKEKMEEAVNFVDDHLKGGNESLDHITESLDFKEYMPENAVQISYSTEPGTPIDAYGNINYKKLNKEVVTLITVCFSYDSEQLEKIYPVRLVPFESGSSQERIQNARQRIEELEETGRSKQELAIPDQLDEVRVTAAKKKKLDPYTILLFGIITGFLISLREEENLKQKKKERDKQLLMDYPDLVNKIILLLGAGMTLRGAIHKISTEYQLRRNPQKIHYAYEELTLTVNELRAGIPENQAYQHYGNRLCLGPYLKLSNLLVQNLKKGTKNLITLLEQEENEAFETRKEQAKRQGEEASIKLLFPMLLLLGVVLILVIYPAIVNFNV